MKTFADAKTQFPQGATTYRLAFRGTGDPNDDHEIIGIQFLAADGRVLLTIGDSTAFEVCP